MRHVRLDAGKSPLSLGEPELLAERSELSEAAMATRVHQPMALRASLRGDPRLIKPRIARSSVKSVDERG
jgi:hypothetical protein